jgi:hypothetical protein
MIIPTEKLLETFRDPFLRAADNSFSSGRGIDVRQAMRLVREGYATWLEEPHPINGRHWSWRLSEVSTVAPISNKPKDSVAHARTSSSS